MGHRTGSDRPSIAPIRHTVLLIVIVLAVAGFGAYRQWKAASEPSLAPHRGSALPLYFSVMAGEWGLLRFVLVGVKRKGMRLGDLIGGRWSRWPDAARDLALGLGVWFGWSVAEGFVARALGYENTGTVEALLPRNPAEIAAWVALSVSAGICEEAIFRGYLQKQFEALTGSAWIAVIGQAVLFGIAHGYQGVRNVVTIAAFGALFGALAHWRRSLRPGMILHSWTDIFSGIFGRTS